MLHRTISVFIAIVLLMGCATMPSEGELERRESAQISADEPPSIPGRDTLKRCLALSGGGIRAATVSYGFLQGLNEDEIKKFDLISTVSGSGYTMYGILHRITRRGDSLATVLKEGGDFEKRFAKDEFIGEVTKYGLFTSSFLTFPFDLALLPARTLYNSDAGAVINANHASLYGMTIHNTFASSRLWPSRENIPLDQLPAENEQVLPYIIFVGTASDGKLAPTRSTAELSRVFEMSRDWTGSKSTGFWRTGALFSGGSDADRLRLWVAVTASAAATDTPTDVDRGRKRLIFRWLKRLGFGVGSTLSFPELKSPSSPASDQSGPGKIRWVYVGDGGFFDNLGVWPAINRGCEDIVVLDMGDDPDYQFRDFIQPDLDHFTSQQCEDEKSSNKAEGRCATSLRSELRKLNIQLECETIEQLLAAEEPVDRLPTNVFSCKAAAILDADKPRYQGSADMKITVLKLGLQADAKYQSNSSWDPILEFVKREGEGFEENCERNRSTGIFSEKKIGKRRCRFPHKSTGIQSLKYPNEVAAYMAVGRFIAAEYLESIKKSPPTKSTIAHESGS